MAGMSLFQPEISKSYGVTEWREDVKVVIVQRSLFLTAPSDTSCKKTGRAEVVRGASEENGVSDHRHSNQRRVLFGRRRQPSQHRGSAELVCY